MKKLFSLGVVWDKNVVVLPGGPKAEVPNGSEGAGGDRIPNIFGDI